MAWIESHQDLKEHPKVSDLMAAMSWDLDTTLGKLHRFWWWCVDYAEDGDLRRHNDNRIAQAMGVAVADARRLVEAMVQSRWIDREPYFRVHDWWDYFGLFLQRKYGERNREKWERIKSLYNGSTTIVPPLSPPNQPTNQPNRPTSPATVVQQLEKRVGELYKRGAGDAWTYAEQTALVDVARRADALLELDHILALRRSMRPEDRLRFFPQSVFSLLSKWTETLDKARIQCPVKKPRSVAPSRSTAGAQKKPPTLEEVRQSIEFLEKQSPNSEMLPQLRDQLRRLEIGK